MEIGEVRLLSETEGPQRGAARSFNAGITYQVTPESPEQSYDLQVNHPLSVDGTKVHLLGHGYAPRVTVRDGKGDWWSAAADAK